MGTLFPDILTNPSTSDLQLNSSGGIDMRKYMWQEAFFPNASLPGKKDKVQDTTDIWKQNLNALVLKEIYSSL